MNRPDVYSKEIKDNETWNDCPKCGFSWKDATPTPGLIHKTRLCARCATKKENGTRRNHRISKPAIN